MDNIDLVKIEEIFKGVFTSPNVSDTNLERANLVDTTHSIATGLHRIADVLEKINNKIPKDKK